MQERFSGLPVGEMLSWTPRFFQTVEVTVRPRFCFYQVFGGFVAVSANCVLTSAGTSGGSMMVSLPMPYFDVRNGADPNFTGYIGYGEYLDAGTAGRPMWLVGFGSDGTAQPDKKSIWATIRTTSVGAGADQPLGGAGGGNFGAANTDEFSFTAFYPLGP